MNLRWSNATLNALNQVRAKGVFLRKQLKSKPYQAYVRVLGKLIHLGYYATYDEAHERYLGERRRVYNLIDPTAA